MSCVTADDGVWGRTPSPEQYAAIVTVLARHRTNHRRRLSKDERNATDAYVNKHENARGQKINEWLYSGRNIVSDSNASLLVRRIDAAFRSSRLTAPCNLFRGLRGPAVSTFTSSWMPGTLVTFPSYLSTSFMPFQALLYGSGESGCLLKFVTDEPTCLYVIFSPTEDEIVLPRGTSWIVNSVMSLIIPSRVTRHPTRSIEHTPSRNIKMFVFHPSTPSMPFDCPD